MGRCTQKMSHAPMGNAPRSRARALLLHGGIISPEGFRPGCVGCFSVVIAIAYLRSGHGWNGWPGTVLWCADFAHLGPPLVHSLDPFYFAISWPKHASQSGRLSAKSTVKLCMLNLAIFRLFYIPQWLTIFILFLWLPLSVPCRMTILVLFLNVFDFLHLY